MLKKKLVLFGLFQILAVIFIKINLNKMFIYKVNSNKSHCFFYY